MYDDAIKKIMFLFYIRWQQMLAWISASIQRISNDSANNIQANARYKGQYRMSTTTCYEYNLKYPIFGRTVDR